MIERLFAAIVRALGAEVERVLLLRDWMERGANGRVQLEIERRSGSTIPVDQKVIKLFFGIMLGFNSIGIAVVTGFSRGVFGIWIVSFFGAIIVFTVISFLAVQRLLPDDDVKLMGWWPVSIREVMLARIGLLLEPALHVMVALATLPLLVLLVVGRPPVIGSLLFASGLLLQTVGLIVGGVLVAATLRRVGGQRKAQRFFHLVYGLIVGVPWLVVYLLLPAGGVALEAWLASPPWATALLPSVWAPSWGLAFTARFAWVGVVASILVAIIGGALMMRGLLSGGRGEPLSPMRSGRPRIPVVPLIEILLAPFARGREGWLVRRLTAAHLRDDPQTLGALGLIPLLLLFEGAILFDRSLLAALAVPAESVPVRIAFLFTLPAVLFPLSMMPSLVYSSDARAAWILATAELHPHRLLAAQRGVARGLTLVPMLVVFALLHVFAGTAPALVVSDLMLSWLVWEAACVAIQSIYPVMPFSRVREGGGMELLAVSVMMMPVWMMLSAWTVLGYELLPWWTGKVLTWTLLGSLVLYLRRRLERNVGERALPVEFAPPVKAS
jgi:hypothetical protein